MRATRLSRTMLRVTAMCAGSVGPIGFRLRVYHGQQRLASTYHSQGPTCGNGHTVALVKSWRTPALRRYRTSSLRVRWTINLGDGSRSGSVPVRAPVRG